MHAQTLLPQPLERPPQTLLPQLASLMWRRGVRFAHVNARKFISLREFCYDLSKKDNRISRCMYIREQASKVEEKNLFLLYITLSLLLWVHILEWTCYRLLNGGGLQGANKGLEALSQRSKVLFVELSKTVL